jgi:multimeric flavodoxin WrbA
MPQILVVHHTPSPAVHAMVAAAVEGAGNPELDGIDVEAVPALSATATDVLAADAYVLVTPVNLGYMSGALKHFFDLVYYPCLDATQRRPYGVVVHGNNDTDGAVLSIERIVTGLRWRAVAAPVECVGEPTGVDLEACWELGAVVAASATLDA